MTLILLVTGLLAPVLFTYPGHASRKLVQLTGGPRNGEWVIARYAAEYP